MVVPERMLTYSAAAESWSSSVEDNLGPAGGWTYDFGSRASIGGSFTDDQGDWNLRDGDLYLRLEDGELVAGADRLLAEVLAVEQGAQELDDLVQALQNPSANDGTQIETPDFAPWLRASWSDFWTLGVCRNSLTLGSPDPDRDVQAARQCVKALGSILGKLPESGGIQQILRSDARRSAGHYVQLSTDEDAETRATVIAPLIEFLDNDTVSRLPGDLARLAKEIVAEEFAELEQRWDRRPARSGERPPATFALAEGTDNILSAPRVEAQPFEPASPDRDAAEGLYVLSDGLARLQPAFADGRSSWFEFLFEPTNSDQPSHVLVEYLEDGDRLEVDLGSSWTGVVRATRHESTTPTNAVIDGVSALAVELLTRDPNEAAAFWNSCRHQWVAVGDTARARRAAEQEYNSSGAPEVGKWIMALEAGRALTIQRGKS